MRPVWVLLALAIASSFAVYQARDEHREPREAPAELARETPLRGRPGGRAQMQRDFPAPREALDEGTRTGEEARAPKTARLRPGHGQGRELEERREALGPRAPRRTPSAAQLELRREERRQREAARREKILARLESPDAQVRASGVFRLDADDPEELDALGAALVDPDVRVRSEAARRLQFGDTAAVPLLRDALADPDPIVVAEAIDSLKFLGDPSVIPDLAPLLDHADSHVRREAEAAIRRLQ